MREASQSGSRESLNYDQEEFFAEPATLAENKLDLAGFCS